MKTKYMLSVLTALSILFFNLPVSKAEEVTEVGSHSNNGKYAFVFYAERPLCADPEERFIGPEVGCMRVVADTPAASDNCEPGEVFNQKTGCVAIAEVPACEPGQNFDPELGNCVWVTTATTPTPTPTPTPIIEETVILETVEDAVVTDPTIPQFIEGSGMGCSLGASIPAVSWLWMFSAPLAFALFGRLRKH